jgi:hypothetical protein
MVGKLKGSRPEGWCDAERKARGVPEMQEMQRRRKED